MNTSCQQFPEIKAIADAICDQQASPEQINQLEQLLAGNPAAARFYYDYINMHIHLKEMAEPDMEFVYRRIREQRIIEERITEEIVVRPSQNTIEKNTNYQQRLSKASTELNSTEPKSIQPKKIIPNGHHSQTDTSNSTSSKKQLHKLGLVIFIALTSLLVISWLNGPEKTVKYSAQLLDGQVNIVDHGQIEAGYLHIGKYQATQDTRLQLAHGEIVELMTHSVVKIFNDSEIKLERGALKITPVAEHNITVHGPKFTLFSNGSELGLDLSAREPMVTTGLTTTISPQRWRPRHYWAFDGFTERAIDSAGFADGISHPGVSRRQGLVGQGAMHFDNSKQAWLDVGNGGGNTPATGTFSVSDGVTIEAVIAPQYSGKPGDNDQIFRKDQSDKKLRLLLSFQNDKGKTTLMPKGEFDESLSFGLFILGQGYHELKLPLDGLDGRPSLADLKDGNAHHVVASYDTHTGVKAIYIDGKLQASFNYPAGAKMLSGGRGKANIGNTPNESRRAIEAFNGTIDEVAFYGFSLPPYMVKQHFEHIQQGKNYFGLLPSTEALPQQITVALPPQAKVQLAPLTGLPQAILPQSRND